MEEFSGILFIELRDIYDGWSVLRMADGRLINRWDVGDRRYVPTQAFIDREMAKVAR